MKKEYYLFVGIMFLFVAASNLTIAGDDHYITFINNLDEPIEIYCMHNFIKISYWSAIIPPHSKRSYKPYYQSYNYEVEFYFPASITGKIEALGILSLFNGNKPYVQNAGKIFIESQYVCCEDGSKTFNISHTGSLDDDTWKIKITKER